MTFLSFPILGHYGHFYGKYIRRSATLVTDEMEKNRKREKHRKRDME